MSRGPVLSLVVARARNGVIGREGKLPWRLKGDMAVFRHVTLGKPVIMGRKTWESLPKRPLEGRANLVLSRDGSFEPKGALVFPRFDDAVELGREQARDEGADEVCVIGGEAVFALALPRARRLHLTEVEAEVEGDVRFAPLDESGWVEAARERFEAGEGNDFAFTYRRLERR